MLSTLSSVGHLLFANSDIEPTTITILLIPNNVTYITSNEGDTAFLQLYCTDLTRDCTGTIEITNGPCEAEYLCVAGGGGGGSSTNGANGGNVRASVVQMNGLYNFTVARAAPKNSTGTNSTINGTNITATAVGGNYSGNSAGRGGGVNGGTGNLSEVTIDGIRFKGGAGVNVSNHVPIIGQLMYSHWGGGGGPGSTTSVATAIGDGGAGGGGGGRIITSAKQRGLSITNQTSYVNSPSGANYSGGGAGGNAPNATGGSGIIIFAFKNRSSINVSISAS